jgi:hypothetical protein
MQKLRMESPETLLEECLSEQDQKRVAERERLAVRYRQFLELLTRSMPEVSGQRDFEKLDATEAKILLEFCAEKQRYGCFDQYKNFVADVIRWIVWRRTALKPAQLGEVPQPYAPFSKKSLIAKFTSLRAGQPVIPPPVFVVGESRLPDPNFVRG